MYHWHVYVWHGRKGPIWLVVGRRRLLAGERRGRWSRRLRTHAARAQLTIGTVSALTKASFARRSLAHTDLVLRCLARYHLFFIFTLFSITLLHDLWFAHERLVMVFCLTVMDCAFVTPVITQSTMRYGLRSGFGVTKTLSNYLL